MASTIRGVAAEIKQGYHSAARLGVWTLTTDASGGDLTAVVVDANTFRLTQPALTFRVIHQKGPAWVWPVLSLHIADGSLTARLGL